MTGTREEALRARLSALGFDEVRFASVAGAWPEAPLREWVGKGLHGEMAWMERTTDKRLDPGLVLAGVRSMILLGVSYADEKPRTVAGESGSRPAWARYALHEDYHDTMKPALVAAGKVLEELFGVGGADYRYYVDTGPVLERSWAARAGIGFVGKNAMLISRTRGNWLFLAAILTTVELAADEPIRRKIEQEKSKVESPVGLLCGKCTRCLDACPTDAFAAPGIVDARRCVSYQTIENKGIIPRELRAGIGARVYGCDVCLEVCPWNRFAQRGREMLLVARRDLAEIGLPELLELTPERFAVVFRKTAIKRLKLVGLLRNACVVAGNSGDTALLPAVARLASHENPTVRAHAVWAAFRLAGAGGPGEWLAPARAAETDATVHAEYAAESAALTAED